MKQYPEPHKKKQRAIGSSSSEKRKTGYVWLNVLPDDLWLKVRRDETIWEVLQTEDVELGGDCGGLGKCGKCKVRILSSIDPPSKEEEDFLDEDEIRQGIRLACRTKISKDLVIDTSEPHPEVEYFQILKTGHRPLFQLHPLVDQRPVIIPPDLTDEGIADLDQIKLAMGPEFQDLQASLHCLRTLPQKLKETGFRGAAVLSEKQLMEWQNWAELGRRYGLVFDLGTSTLVGKLINLMDGSEVAVSSCLNSQIKYGSNVISRLQFVKDHPNGLQHLHDLLLNDLNRITKRLLEVADLEPNHIFIAVVAGNTSMQHFFLSLDPLGIAEAPFTPVLTDGLVVMATDVGLQMHHEGLVYMMPMKSGYIGGDLISAILASGATEQDDDIVLGLDLGTNGEIFLGNSKRLLTCSAAAGPALEGARIAHGMIAKAGAIEGVTFEDGELHYRIIGNISPKGICGSGLVDLVAVLLENGVIDHEGLICHGDEISDDNLMSRVVERENGREFLIAPPEESHHHKPIYLTQRDVRELQLAKGAIAAGIKTLMDDMGIGPADINRVCLAGALGNYVSPHNAMQIGLIPAFDPGILVSLGNAASTGASMALLSKYYWQMANEISDSIEHVELSSRIDFNDYFVEHMDFPPQNLLDMQRSDMGNVLNTIHVGDVMTYDFPTVPLTLTVTELINRLRNSGHHGFSVLDDAGHLYGVVTGTDIKKSLQTGLRGLTVGDIATVQPFVAYPDQTLLEVLAASEKDHGRIPVVERNDKTSLIGVLRRHDIIRAYRRKLADSAKVQGGY